MTTLTDLSARQCIHALDKGEISARELVRACLERIEKLDPKLHAFLNLIPEQALHTAEAADRKRKSANKSGANLPPLLGLPIAIKDVLALKGVPCTCGSKILKNFIPPYTATAVQRLINAGVIPLGKTNTDEFAMGSSTENSAYGPTLNPWDTGRVPGGSSGGSAAAVAARLVPAALGTDTGGSVRQPAAFCGISGIKPTYGRVSRYGLVAYGSSLDAVGVLARNVDDLALLFTHMAGHDRRDATSMDLPVADIQLNGTSGLKGFRVGVPQEYFIDGIQPAVERSIHRAIENLRDLGAQVYGVSLPHTEYALPVYYLIAPAEASANLARYDGIRFGPQAEAQTLGDLFRRTRGSLFGAEVKRRIMLGTYALSAGYYEAYYGQAQKVRTLIKADFEKAFTQVDIIAAPVAPSTAFRFGEHTDDPLAMYLEDVFTLPANLAGVPGLSFPVGFDANNLPVGMQLMGPHYREDLLFRVAHAYQQITDYHLRAPGI